MNIEYEKLKIADGYYCIENDIVINRSYFQCPAPLGSRVFYTSEEDLLEFLDSSSREVSLIHTSKVLAWMEPEKDEPSI
jgi:hypothetical protein